MRNTKWNITVLTTALALTLFCIGAATATQSGKQSQDRKGEKNEPVSGSGVYRVTYNVNEVENGKTVNSRSYTLMAQLGKTASARIQTSVPYFTNTGKDSPFQFHDVFMNIDCTLGREEDTALVNTTLYMATTKGKQTISTDRSQPVFGELRLMDVTSAILGKQAFVGSLDDVASNRHYVIEVTVTKVK